MAIYMWREQTENIIMSISDIDEQSEFEALWIFPNEKTVVVSWTNPITFGYSSATRYWGWKTKVDISMPLKGEFYLDCVFNVHNYNSESKIWIDCGSIWSIWIDQATINVSSSNPQFSYPWGAVSPTSVNFMDGNRHTVRCTWDNDIYNARIDSTQILTNATWTAPTSNTVFRFRIYGWDQNSIKTKSVYDFYVKEII